MYRSQPVSFSIMDWVAKRSGMQWVGSGLLLGSGFIVPWLWPLGLVGVVWFVDLVQRTDGWRQLLWWGWVTFTVKALCGLVWFWSVYPIDWLAIDVGNEQLVLIFLYWVTASMWLGSAGMIAAVLLKACLSRFTKEWILALLIPLVWVGAEVLGSLIFSVLTWGEGAVITSAFSFGFVGLLGAGHEWLVFGSVVGGLYGLGWLFVCFAMIARSVWRNGDVGFKVALLAFLALGFVPAPLPHHNPTEGSVVMTIDTNFPLNQIRTRAGSQQIRQELETAVDQAMGYAPDYLILPEDARFFNQTQPVSQVRTRFQLQYPEAETVIVDSGRTLDGADTALRSFVYNGKSGSVDRSHKRYLVPQGEFMPFLYTQALRLAGYGELVDVVARDLAYHVGSDTDQSGFAASSPGVLFCFESVSPFGVRTLMQERPDLPFVAHPISHSWFNDPDILWFNLDRMLRVQAIWSQQYIVSAGSQVRGAVYTPWGGVEWLETVSSGEGWTLNRTIIPD